MRAIYQSKIGLGLMDIGRIFFYTINDWKKRKATFMCTSPITSHQHFPIVGHVTVAEVSLFVGLML